jgi:hypothetical protein
MRRSEALSMHCKNEPKRRNMAVIRCQLHGWEIPEPKMSIFLYIYMCIYIYVYIIYICIYRVKAGGFPGSQLHFICMDMENVDFTLGFTVLYAFL